MPGMFKGMGYGEQQPKSRMESSAPSTASAVPTTRTHSGPEGATVDADYSPAPNTVTSGYPIASSGSALSSEDLKIPYASGSYRIPTPSYAQYYNTSSALRPTGAYGTAASSGFPWGNSPSQQTMPTAGGLSAMCNCPQASTVTVQNTITVQNTVTAPPVTITLTSTISATPELPPIITPTVTITITTTVCGSVSPNTGQPGSGPPAVPSLDGGQQSGSDIFGPSAPITGPPGSVIETSSSAPAFITSGFSPPIPVPAAISSSYPIPFTNKTGSSGIPLPSGPGAYQAPETPQTSSSDLTQPQPTGMPVDSGAYGSPTSSYPRSPPSIPSISPPISYPLSNPSLVGSGGGSAPASSNPTDQQTPASYPAESMIAPSPGKSTEGLSISPVPSSPSVTYGGGPALPSSPSGQDNITSPSSQDNITSPSGQDNITGAPTGNPVAPPYVSDNSTSLGPGPGTGAPANGTGSVIPPASPAVPGQTSPSSQGNLDTNLPAPYPTSNAGHTSQGSGFPAPTQPPSSASVPFANFTSPLPSAPLPDTGIPYQPGTNPASPYQSTAPPSAPSSSAPSVPPPTPPLYGNNTGTSPGPGYPLPSIGGNPLASPSNPGTGMMYSTMTQMVVPYPAASPSDNYPAQVPSPNPSGSSNSTSSSSCSTTASGNGSFASPSIPNPEQSPTTPTLPNNSSPSPVIPQPQASSPGIPMPSPSAPPPLPPPAPAGVPIASSPAVASSPTPIPSPPPPPAVNSSSSTPVPSLPPPPAVSSGSSTPVPSLPPPPAAGTNTPIPSPSCSPTLKDAMYKADFNTLTTLQPLPNPYGPLNITGFTIDNGSPTPHLTSSANSTMKSIAIAPSTNHFNLTSLSLACSIPPCKVTMVGVKVPSTTMQGAAAGAISYKTVRVEAADHGADPYTVVDGLDADAGWQDLQRVNFIGKAVDGSDGDVGVGLDDLVYWARTWEGCDDDGGGTKLDDWKNTL
ncbi:MAG: hypothetical protein Q9218_002863 [Villophora microphyllina]